MTTQPTQDGYDWPNGQHDEQCWPATAAATALANAKRLHAINKAGVCERRCVLASCACARYAGGPRASCGYLDA
jgi:hypothetical protein